MRTPFSSRALLTAAVCAALSATCALSADPILDVYQVDVPPKITEIVHPKLPYLMRRREAENDGYAVVEAVIDAQGHVHAPRVIAMTDTELVAPSIDAVSRWKFKPALKHGIPVAVRGPFAVWYHRHMQAHAAPRNQLTRLLYLIRSRWAAAHTDGGIAEQVSLPADHPSEAIWLIPDSGTRLICDPVAANTFRMTRPAVDFVNAQLAHATVTPDMLAIVRHFGGLWLVLPSFDAKS